jgi:ABC-type amino acid transport substrate-binding protein
MIKKLLPLFALLGAVILNTACSSSPTQARIVRDKQAKIGASAFQAPLLYFKEREALGPDAELARRIVDKMNAEWLEPNAPRKIVPAWVNREGDALLPALRDEADFLLGVGVTKEAEEKGDITFSTPYYKSDLVLLHNPILRELTKEKTVGQRIGVRAGTAIEQIVKKTYRAQPVPFETLDEAVLSLRRGEVGGVVDDQYMAAYSLDTLGGCGQLEIVPGSLGTVDIAAAVRKGDDELLTLINSVIAGMNGDYARILAENDAGRLAKVKQRYYARKKVEEERRRPRQVTIRIYKDPGSPVDVYRFANLSFTLTNVNDPAQVYTTSRVDFQGKVGYCNVTMPPGTYLMTQPKFGFTARVIIAENAERTVTLSIRFDKAGNIMVG